MFFPVESLPLPLRWLAYVSPLWHAVDLSRAATLGILPSWSVTGHLLYLAAWAVAGWLLARARFRRRLHCLTAGFIALHRLTRTEAPWSLWCCPGCSVSPTGRGAPRR